MLLCFQSCLQNKEQKEHILASLKGCTEVEMIYYNHNDTLIYKAKNALEIEALTELILGKNDTIVDSCKPSGQLAFKNKGQKIFTAEFSTTATNQDIECNCIVYKIVDKKYKHKLTYRAGMFIDDILWGKLKWSSHVGHGLIRLYEDSTKQSGTNNN